MHKLPIKTVTIDTVFEMLWKAWELAKAHYAMVWILIVLFMINEALSSTSVFGLFFVIFSSLLPVFFLIAADAWEKGIPITVKEVFSAVFDGKLLIRLAPLMGLKVVFSILILFMPALPILPGGATLATSILTIPITFFFSMALPILLFNSELKTVDTLELSAIGIYKNLIPAIAGFFILSVLIFVTIIVFVLPFIFITVPILLLQTYLWYRAIYTEIDMKVENKKII